MMMPQKLLGVFSWLLPGALPSLTPPGLPPCPLPVPVLSEQSAPRLSQQDLCTSFRIQNPPTPVVRINATHYAAGHHLDLHSSSGAVNASGFPSFCRLEFSVHTNPANAHATAITEVWLPDAWGGRLVGFGNAGWSGGVNYGDLAYVGLRGGHAGMSTDAGHHSTSANGSWALHNDDALIDFGGRAMHLSVELAKAVVSQYYGSAAIKSYYLGCSTGGREGLKAVQDYPTDFDGVAVGAPANWLSHMHPWAIHMQLQVLPTSGPQWIPTALWDFLHQVVLKQCDDIDLVDDGIINDPRLCPFVLEPYACSSGQDPCDSDGKCTCFNSNQTAALYKIYSTYYEEDNTYIFGPLMPGGELEYPHGLLGPKPFETAIDYFKYMVLNCTHWSYKTLDFQDIQKADAIDPGTMNAIKTDITAFSGPSHNGKLIQYFGWADQYISPMNSLHYYNSVKNYMDSNTDMDIDDYYRLFPVPSMQHCYGGVGANAFGGAQQAEKGMPPGQNDSSHDVLLGLIEWVEKGVAPESFIATKYLGDNTTKVEMTRPICKVGKVLVWDGHGNVNASTSWSCQ